MRLLIFTGFSGFTQRLDNVACLIQEDFNATIDALVYGEANHNYLCKKGKASYREILCVEHLFREAASSAQASPEELRLWEERLGHSLEPGFSSQADHWSNTI